MKKYELSDNWAYKKICEYCKLQMEIDKEVKNKKTKEKLTARKLAKRAGVSSKTIYNFISGKMVHENIFADINRAFGELKNEELYDYYLELIGQKKIESGDKIEFSESAKADIFLMEEIMTHAKNYPVQDIQTVIDIKNIGAYKKTCEYFSRKMEEMSTIFPKITIKSVIEKSQIAESTMYDFKSGKSVEVYTFQRINNVYMELMKGESLYNYYCTTVCNMLESGKLLFPDIINIKKEDESGVKTLGLEKLLKDLNINRKIFLSTCLSGVSLNILAIERGNMKIKMENQGDRQNEENLAEKNIYEKVKIYVYFLENDSYEKTCVFHGVIKNLYKKLPCRKILCGCEDKQNITIENYIYINEKQNDTKENMQHFLSIEDFNKIARCVNNNILEMKEFMNVIFEPTETEKSGYIETDYIPDRRNIIEWLNDNYSTDNTLKDKL